MTKKIVALALAALLIAAALVAVLVGFTPRQISSGVGDPMAAPEDVYAALGYSGLQAYAADMAAEATPVCVQHAYYLDQTLTQDSGETAGSSINRVRTGTMTVYVVEGGVYARSKGKLIANSTQSPGSGSLSYSYMVEFDAELYITDGKIYVRYATYDRMDATTDTISGEAQPSVDSIQGAAFCQAIGGVLHRWIAVEDQPDADEDRLAYGQYLYNTLQQMFDWDTWTTYARYGVGSASPAEGAFDWLDSVRDIAAGLPVETPVNANSLYRSDLGGNGSMTLLMDNPNRPCISLQAQTNVTSGGANIASTMQLCMVISGLGNTTVQLNTDKAVPLATVTAAAVQQQGGAQ